jgi:hypothetical protein
MPVPQLTPREIAKKGDHIYRDVLMPEYEPEHFGKYLAINIHNGNAVLASTPEEAVVLARQSDPSGLFHLVRIGYTGVFSIGHARSDERSTDWILG